MGTDMERAGTDIAADQIARPAPVPLRELSRTVRRSELGPRIGEAVLETADGERLVRRFLHTPEVVAIVAVDGDDLLLIREYRAAVGAPVVQLPMGKVPAGHAPLDQAKAELAEEVGVEAARWTGLARLYSCPGWMDQVLHLFGASQLTALSRRADSGDPDDIEEQGIEVVRVRLARFPAEVASGRIQDARTIAGVYTAAAAGFLDLGRPADGEAKH